MPIVNAPLVVISVVITIHAPSARISSVMPCSSVLATVL